MNDKKYIKNCHFCVYLGSDDSGDDYGSHSFPVCNRPSNTGKDNLKSFPFNKPQSCHVPDFWAVLETDKEMQKLYEKDDHLSYMNNWKSLQLFIKKY